MTICFDIGGSAIKAALATPRGEVRPFARIATPLDDFGAFVQALAQLRRQGGAGAGDDIAVSITGVVDPRSEIIACANIPCIDGRRLAPDLAERLGVPVHVANDADCFALAEAVKGAGRGHRIVFGIIIGTGIGGGLVVDGRILTGAGGFAGEWGHGPVVASEAGEPPVAIPRFACGCGQEGCVDTVGGARGLERLHRHLTGDACESTEIIAAWRAGDAAAARTVACQVDLVASPLALAINIVGADIVPVGGGLASVPELIARLDEAVRHRILRRSSAPLVVPSTLAPEPGLIGAALLAHQGERS
ncbi:N-acetylglucosamine kinase [Labrys okinawensis]|uniref:N-acetylglucosamine kinase n=1 Tax=Labrys okinawensis TaxID=346911 RepID=A0A2S9Q3X9_9HYPH|nr:ROK family protein [Labrys okinawensis]PRH84067.1 N-acetylglucosamine kinase [Labrys okinawensis]